MSYFFDPTSTTDASTIKSRYFRSPSGLLSSKYLVGMPVKYGSSYYGILCTCVNHGTDYDIFADRAVHEFYLTNLSSGEVLASYDLYLSTEGHNDSNLSPSGVILGDDALYYAYIEHSGDFFYGTNYYYIVKYDLLTNTTTTIDSKTVSSGTSGSYPYGGMALASCACIKDGSDAYFVLSGMYLYQPSALDLRYKYWIEKVDLNTDAHTEVVWATESFDASDSHAGKAPGWNNFLSLDDSGYLYFALSSYSSIGGLYCIKTDGTDFNKVTGFRETKFCVGGPKGLHFASWNFDADKYSHYELQNKSIKNRWPDNTNYIALTGFSDGIAGGYLLDGSSYPYYLLLFEEGSCDSKFVKLYDDESVDVDTINITAGSNKAKTIRSGGMIIDASNDDFIKYGMGIWGPDGVHGIQIPQKLEII